MLRCPNCHHSNPDHSRYCKYCGINLGDYLRAARQPVPTTQQPALLQKVWRWLKSKTRAL